MIQGIIAIARPLVIWLVQAGLTTVLFTIVDQLLNKVQDIIRDYYGIDDKSAGAVWTNILLDAAAYAGIGAAVLSKKIPLSVAKRMGLDTSKPAKLIVSKEAAAKIGAKDAAAGGKGYKTYIDGAIKVLGVPAAFIWLTSAVANIVEPGIYKPEQTNAVYKALGIPFQYPTSAAAGSPGGFEPGEFTDYFRALETAGASSISNPCKLQDMPFSRDNLVALVDCVYGTEAAAGRPTTAAKLKVALAPHIRLSNGKTASPTAGAVTGASSGSTSTKTPSQGTVESLPKVFTGLVSQGSLGNSDNFVPRPDDLITDIDDLTKAAANNIAPFLAALPGRIRYEIKIVTSYVDKNGFTHRGTAQQIQSGTYTNGSPKYKTVVNRFAICDMYVVTSKGTRTKIDSIVLGPVDSGRFQPSTETVGSLVTTLEKSLTSTYSSAAKLSADESKNTSTKTKEAQFSNTKVEGKPVAVMIRKNEDGTTTYPLIYITRGQRVESEYTGKSILAVWPKIKNLGGATVESFAGLTPQEIDEGNFFDPGLPEDEIRIEKAKPASETEGRTSKIQKVDTGEAGATASPYAATLSEYYQLRGQSLPSIQDRGALYESLGLGAMAYYTGTAEQNVKLLTALQAQ